MMAENFDTSLYYSKLANNEPLTEVEVVRLLKAVETYQAGVAFLADCQAATAESLPKSASKSSRTRHAAICRTAAGLLDGNIHVLSHRARPDAAQARCLRAVKDLEGS
jgi:hypothetical protein